MAMSLPTCWTIKGVSPSGVLLAMITPVSATLILAM